MNAASEARPLAEAASQTPIAPRSENAVQVLAKWHVGSDAFLMVGFAPMSFPASGAAQRKLGTVDGIFRCVTWPGKRTDDAGGQAFLAAVRLSERSDTGGNETLLLRGETGEGLMMRLPPTATDGKTFGRQVARIGGSHGAPIARFMLNVLHPRADRHPPHIDALLAGMMHAFLTETAEPDGCVEIVTTIPDSCVLLQGWGSRLGGPLRILSARRTLSWFHGHAGEFDRPDIAPPAVGVVLTLPCQAADDVTDADHLFVISDQGVHSRSLTGHRLLERADGVGHIRRMLPSLRCPSPMGELLRSALRPRYEGRSTLDEVPHPIRAAVDFAAAASGAGVFIAGWVLDPEGRVAGIHLCGTDGFVSRLDDVLVRVARPDVTDAFREIPGFPPSQDNHSGFAVSTFAAPVAETSLYLRFTFSDGDSAFLPVATADLGEAEVRVRLLAGVDMFKPSGVPILEGHVAPLLSRLRPSTGPVARFLISGPAQRRHAVVVPLATDALPRAFLSGFLRDPADAAEQIVLVCGPEWNSAGLEALGRLIRFHDLPASILITADTAEPAMAVREAVRTTSAEVFLLAAPTISGATGWRRALFAAATGGDAFACPTLLYEDWSIRYAGAGFLRFRDESPFARMSVPLAGMPAALAAGDAPVAAAMGTLECCAMPRGTLAAMGDSNAFATNVGREADFFERLKASGRAGVWVPSVQLYAPESRDKASAGEAGPIVDGWMLRSKWRLGREA